jgi:hypothetical protein
MTVLEVTGLGRFNLMAVAIASVVSSILIPEAKTDGRSCLWPKIPASLLRGIATDISS